MRAGRLSSRVTIVQRADLQNDIGELVPTWSTLSTVWADVIHKSGLETIKAGASASVVKASIRIRYRADVKPSMRVVNGAEVAVLADPAPADPAPVQAKQVVKKAARK